MVREEAEAREVEQMKHEEAAQNSADGESDEEAPIYNPKNVRLLVRPFSRDSSPPLSPIPSPHYPPRLHSLLPSPPHLIYRDSISSESATHNLTLAVPRYIFIICAFRYLPGASRLGWQTDPFLALQIARPRPNLHVRDLPRRIVSRTSRLRAPLLWVAARGGDEGVKYSQHEGEFILFTVTLCANPAHDLTCPPSYIIIFKYSQHEALPRRDDDRRGGEALGTP